MLSRWNMLHQCIIYSTNNTHLYLGLHYNTRALTKVRIQLVRTGKKINIVKTLVLWNSNLEEKLHK